MDASALTLLLLRILATIAGAILLYGAFFLYPGERNTVQSALDAWWVRLDDARQKAQRGEPVFIHTIAQTTHRGFDVVFGEPLSVRFFVMSGVLSMVSYSIALSTIGDFGWAVPTGLLFFGVVGAWMISASWKTNTDLEQLRQTQRTAFLKYDMLASNRLHTTYSPFLKPPGFQNFNPPPVKRWWEDTPDYLAQYLPIILMTSSSGLILAGAKQQGAGMGLFMMSALTSYLSDVVSIFVTMLILERLVKTRTTAHAAGWLLLDGVMVAALFLLPFGAFWFLADQQSTFGRYLIFVASANISTAAPSAAYVAVVLALLLHRIFWPLLLRPLYGLIQGKKITSPKVLGGAALAMLTIAWPQVFAPFRPLIKALADLF